MDAFPEVRRGGGAARCPSPDELRRIVVHDTEPLSASGWEALAALGSPLLTVDPDDPTRARALFTWRAGPSDPSGGAYLWVNRLTDKRHTARGVMRRRTAGDLWIADLTVPRDILATYRILPLRRSAAPGDDPIPPPRELLREGRSDSLNAAAAAGSPFGSVLAGPDAPSLDAWTAPATASSSVVDRTLRTGPAPLRYRIAVPDGSGPMDLLVIFDADAWVDRFRLPDVLAASGRRCAVLGVDSPTEPAARLRFLSAHAALFAALAGEALPEARGLVGAAARVTIAGQSLGGLAALAFAAEHPDLVDDVLAYSPSVWWRPGLAARPADIATRPGWITTAITACPPGAFGIRLASGTYEEELGPGVHDLAAAARSAGHDVTETVYTGGHDHAQWAALLLEDLSDRR